MLARYQAGFNLLGRLTVMQGAQSKVKQPLRLATGSRLRTFAADIDDKHQDGTMRVDFDRCDRLPARPDAGHARRLRWAHAPV